MKAHLHSTCQIKTTKKTTSSFGNEPPLTRPPAAAANDTARQLHLFSALVLQMLVWLLLRTDESCRQGMEKGSERKKRAQCGAVVDCGSSEGGMSSEGLEKQLSGLLSTRVQQFTESQSQYGLKVWGLVTGGQMKRQRKKLRRGPVCFINLSVAIPSGLGWKGQWPHAGRRE
ncbi:hypothetical protein QQF64_035390 [Cirrhinus molitorella]|uniref:Uncharacterized protein n=1 Tax=Cirrhinus molitorella TaxID=172907 RepID=A0ABR3NFV9_9TELE